MGQSEELVARGQQVHRALKYAPFPTVGAPSGLALGGGCEILLHCAAIQAHAEAYIGLAETSVGIVPAWGGCKEMLLRHMADRRRPGGPMPLSMRPTEGPAENIKMIEAGEAQVGFVTMGVAQQGWNGTGG